MFQVFLFVQYDADVTCLTNKSHLNFSRTLSSRSVIMLRPFSSVLIPTKFMTFKIQRHSWTLCIKSQKIVKMGSIERELDKGKKFPTKMMLLPRWAWVILCLVRLYCILCLIMIWLILPCIHSELSWCCSIMIHVIPWIRWYLPFLKNRIIQDICHSWLCFEREHGSLEEFDIAVQKVLIYVTCWSVL